MMDLLYIVKEGEENEELRYSIRSAVTNYHFNNLVIAGYKPSWLKHVVHIPTVQNKDTKYENSTANLKAACESNILSSDFVLMNDDFFILKPTREILPYHRGNVEEVIRHYENKFATRYLWGMKKTYELIRKFKPEGIVNSYELHVPMIMNKAKVLEMLELPRLHKIKIQALHKRTLYGNYANVGGQAIEDVKVYKGKNLDYSDLRFVSSDDYTFKWHKLGLDVRRQFPTPSVFEV